MEIIIGKKAGFCAGVENAVKKANEILENSNCNIIYCLGKLVHNPIVVQKLYKKGLRIIKSLSEVNTLESNNVIIRAHGVSKKTYEDAKKMNINLIDLTCPNVLVIHKLIEQYKNNGYFTLLIGEKSHPETIGTSSFADDNIVVVENELQLQNSIQYIKNMNIQKLFVTVQTTFSLEKFNMFVSKIKNELNVEIVIKNTICNATKERQEETSSISSKADCMIIIGGKNSANTNKLYNISCANCKKVIFIEKANDITQDQINNIKNSNIVGIMAGASTPKESIIEVKNIIEK